MTEAIPAATLVLFRDSADGPEHLFVERAATMVFAGGAVVFPGGRVDPGDREAATRFPALDPDDAAARIAAIRETVEEAGIAVGLVGTVDVEAVRTALHDGATIGNVLDRHGLSLDLDALVPFARWRPNLKETRTFDTRFYLARVAADHADARVDRTENVHLFWETAANVISLADDHKVKIIYPTRRNLERLATLDSFDAARAFSVACAVETITPWIEERNGTAHLCIPEGLGYPVTSEQLSTAMRG